MKRSLTRSCLLAALLCSPLAMAVGTSTTYPDDPHNPGPAPGVDSTLNPIQQPMPRDTDPRVPNAESESPSIKQKDDADLPGMDQTGSEGGGAQGDGGANR